MKSDIAERYAQVAQVLSGKLLYVDEIKRAIGASEIYTRKLVADLVYSGHLTETRVPSVKGRTRGKYTWVPGKRPPVHSTRDVPRPKPKVARTDPLMIALFGPAVARGDL